MMYVSSESNKSRSSTGTTLGLWTLSLLLCACGGARTTLEPKPPPPPADANLLDLAPAGEQQALWVDLAKLRSSALWSFSELAGADRRIDALKKETGTDLLVEADEILAVGTGAKRSTQTGDRFLLLIKGVRDAQAIAGSLDSTEAADTTEKTVGDEDGISPKGGMPEIIRWGGIAVAALTPRTLAMGDDEMVEKASALARGEGRAMSADPAFETFRLGPDHCAVLRYSRGEGPPDLRNLKGPAAGWSWKRAVVLLEGSLVVGKTLDLKLDATMDSEKDASRAAADINKSVRRTRKNTLVRLMGVDRFLNGVKAKSTQQSLELRVLYDEESLRSISDLAQKLKNIKNMLNPDNDLELEDEDGAEPVKLKFEWSTKKRSSEKEEK